jgi:hypothetical protein
MGILVNLAEATVGLRKGGFGFWKARNLGNTLSANMVGLGLNFAVLFTEGGVNKGHGKSRGFCGLQVGLLKTLTLRKLLRPCVGIGK